MIGFEYSDAVEIWDLAEQVSRKDRESSLYHGLTRVSLKRSLIRDVSDEALQIGSQAYLPSISVLSVKSEPNSEDTPQPMDSRGAKPCVADNDEVTDEQIEKFRNKISSTGLYLGDVKQVSHSSEKSRKARGWIRSLLQSKSILQGFSALSLSDKVSYVYHHCSGVIQPDSHTLSTAFGSHT